MMMNSTTENKEVLKVQIENVHRDVSFETKFCKVEQRELLKLLNPHYADLIKTCHHLRGITMDDNDQKKELPVHVILGASDYSRIKTMTKPRIGQPGEPVAEKTQLGWTIISPGRESESLSNLLLTRNSTCDHDQLCRLDVLGIEYQPSGNQEFVYKKFKDQLQRYPEGFYETFLIWKVRYSTLDNNKAGSLLHLKSISGKVKKNPKEFEQYDNIVKEQFAEGIIKRVKIHPNFKQYYVPHKPFIRENAESRKMRIVYDAFRQIKLLLQPFIKPMFKH